MISLDRVGIAAMPSFTNGFPLAGIAMLDPVGHSPGNLHDKQSRETLVTRLAALLRIPRLGSVTDPDDVGPDVLLVPRDTLIAETMTSKTRLSIGTLLGGLTPYRFAATKAITHGLIGKDAAHPEGWCASMAERLGDAALKGYTAFTPQDAVEGGRRLLRSGPARVKEVCARASLGQTVVETERQLISVIEAQDPGQLAAFGIVIEENLFDVETYSVGSLSVAGLEISYVGDQQETIDHKGRNVYGGSSLRSVRGGLDRLTHLGLDTEATEAIRCAAVFDDAARRAYPSMVLTRRNYDVIAGRDARGLRRVGVLEQSWRIGGATGAEIAALEAFADAPELTSVHTVTVERYEVSETPEGAALYFKGVDPVVGPMTKYAMRIA